MDFIVAPSESPMKRQREANNPNDENRAGDLPPEGKGTEVDAEGMEVGEEPELSAWGRLAEVLSMNLRKLASFDFVFKMVIEQK